MHTYGYSGNILHVDLSAGNTINEPLRTEVIDPYMGAVQR